MTFEEVGIKTKVGHTRYYTICPECNESRQKHKNVPCLTVNDEPGNQWWKCHHCGWSGNLGIHDKYKQVVEKSRMPKEFPKTYTKEVREYFLSRGLDVKTCMNEKIYEFALAGKPVIGFPFYINLTLVNVKYFNPRWKPGDDGPKWWQMSKDYGTKAIFMGMQSISFGRGEEMHDKKVIIITEGEWDWLTWKQCGYNNALTVPQGAPDPRSKNFTDEFNYANDPFVQSFFKDVDLIIFSTDNDKPGILLRNQLALIFGKERCKYINYPVGYKDINDVYNGNKKLNLPALGQEGVDECYQSLSSFAVAGIIRPSDVKDDLNTYAKDGFTPGYGIGIPEIDNLFTLKRKLIMFLTGVPGSGKSVFARWYAGEFVRHNDAEDMKWALFTPENRPVAREYARLAEVLTGFSFKEGSRNAMTPDLRAKTLRFIEKHFFIISPDKKNFETWKDKDIKADKVNSMESVLQYLIYLKKTENIFGYIIDAWNKIEHEQPKYMTETAFISQQLDYLINFNDMYDVFGMVIVHPKKIDQQGANYKMPSLYDIKGSSAWKEKADYGVVAHRYKNKRRPNAEIPDDADEDDKYIVVKDAPTIIRTEKIRFEETGSEDRVKLMMDVNKGGRFYVYKDIKTPEPIVHKLHPSKAELEEMESRHDDIPVKSIFDTEPDLPF
jgi:twinkle protein